MITLYFLISASGLVASQLARHSASSSSSDFMVIPSIYRI